MPQRWLRAHVEAMPEICARESFLEVSRSLVATGKMKKTDLERTIAEWKRDAGITTAVRPKTRKEMVDALRGMGVG